MNDDELMRYSRQVMLTEVDIEGQERILAGSVAIFGLGGLGSPVAIYLASSGVGKLTLIDDDHVDVTNLPRQIVHYTGDIGNMKVKSASETLKLLNPDLELEIHDKRLSEAGLRDVANRVDVVIDATDNFSSRYAINQACTDTLTPLVSGAAIRMEGQVSVFDYSNPDSPCYQCLYQDGLDEELNCAENGVIAPLVGIIGTIQANETLKLLGKFGTPLVNRVLYFDAKRMDFRILRLNRNPACTVCSTRPTPSN